MAFLDARQVDDQTVVVADICIVGAGAAGIALAREMIGAPIRVAVVESGDRTFRHRPQFLNIGENRGRDSFPTCHSRFRVFGGSTTRWGGQCRPLDPLDFETRDGIPYSGWPFGFDHLEPYYRRAQEICNLGPYDYDPERWSLAEGNTLSVPSDSLDTVIYQFSYPSDFGQAYYWDLQAAANVAIYLNASVTEIQTTSDATTVTGLAACTFNRKNIRFIAKHFILACGGIENPRLLLASNRVASQGLGNQNDLVGRFFMDHPYFLTGYFQPARPALARNFYVIEDYERVGRDQKINAGFTLKAAARRAAGINGAALYFTRRPRYKSLPEYFSPAGKSFNHLVNIMRHDDVPNHRFAGHLRNILCGLDTIAVNLGRQASERFRPVPLLGLRAVLEATPNPDSRVMLGRRRDYFGMPRVRVDWRLNSGDTNGLNKLLSVLRKEIRRHALGHLVEDHTLDDSGWPQSMTGGKHHMGTTRMHDDAKLGVVDATCRVHGMANFYLAGSSVFPTGGYANPTLTLVALAIRLADHLKGQLCASGANVT